MMKSEKNMNNVMRRMLFQTLLIFLLLVSSAFCSENGNDSTSAKSLNEAKYDGDGFTLYPSQFVVHTKKGDFFFFFPVNVDQETLNHLIQVLNRAEKTQTTDWPTIQQKIILCREAACDDALLLDVRENDSLLVNANIGGEVFNLVTYFPEASLMSILALLLVSTSSIWVVLLVGIIGFFISYKKRAKRLKKEIPVYSAANEEVESHEENACDITDDSKRESFMWSAFFGGALISYFVHRSEIRRSGKSFFWVVFWKCFIPTLIVRGIDNRIANAMDKLTMNMAENISTLCFLCIIFETLMFIAYSLFIAHVAASRFEEIRPNYNLDDYNRNEIKGVIIGVIYSLIISAVFFMF